MVDPTKQSRCPQLRKLIFRLGAIIGSLIFLLVAIEIGLHLTGHFLIKTIALDTAANPDAPSGFLAACFGDSVTYGPIDTTLRSYSYPAQLERLLRREHPTLGVRVLNEGICGANSADVIERLKSRLAAYTRAPDLLIVMAGTNDMWNLHAATPLKNGSASLPAGKQWLAKLETTRVGKLSAMLGLRGAALVNRLLETKGEGEQSRNWQTEDSRYVCVLHPELPEERPFLETWLRQDLAEIRRIGDAAGIPILIGLYHLSQMNPLIREAATQAGLPVCDPPGHGDAYWKMTGLLSSDGWHPNEKGYAVIARHFAACFESLALIRNAAEKK
ncbi:MAG: hypothetical protein GX444_04030 [Myxococcales bacterium]|nr:hypothetical protein [Myxococcales bacterium]